jgi:hypothetical protein
MGARVDFLVRRLREEGDDLIQQLTKLAPQAWSSPIYRDATTAPWTIHCILAHLVSAEGHLRLMIEDIARGGRGVPPGIDIDAVNASEVEALTRYGTGELIEQLRQSREVSVAQVLAFSDDDLDRRGNHPVLGDMPVEDFVKLIYRHDKMHMRDVQRALKT